MTMTTVDALQSLKPNAEWTLMVDGSLVWHDTKQTQPTEKELADEVIRLQAEYDAQDYARKRAAEYPAIGDQLDALFHAGVFPAEMAAELQAVKDKYPKV